MKNCDINIRDPFVLVHEGKYYLFGSRGASCWGGKQNGFDVYVGDDLENWDGPYVCFDNDGTFWSDREYWAPEVHEWNGRFYMFASFNAPDRRRGTAVLSADNPMGPYKPHSDGCITPAEWECLDGTFYVSKDGRPYMVFCHEWLQAGDGKICYIPLRNDLTGPDGEAKTIFTASEAEWCTSFKTENGQPAYVTDGPFMWRTQDGRLLMLWASFSNGEYTEGLAVSDNDEINGKFTQLEPVFEKDGGHAMLFRDMDGNIMMTLHSPNKNLLERPCFFRMKEVDGRLERA
ncbi:MAG: family 43 glycosylhydrolase [Clostridia bacterium]|nr:family 43 glycosylhydrolase [Clostridia bacterium]